MSPIISEIRTFFQRKTQDERELWLRSGLLERECVVASSLNAGTSPDRSTPQEEALTDFLAVLRPSTLSSILVD